MPGKIQRSSVLKTGMEDCIIYELSNGMRVVHKEVANTKIAHCGFVFDIGSRDEQEHEQGIAHFWEHMVFKGTKKRKAYHIINRLESLGGELNAYTTKEKIFFYAAILDEHFDKAFELLSDITFNSVFPQKQLETEKQVILEEMAMYKDSFEDAIADDFEAQVFQNHPLGYNILGTEKTVSSFQKKNFDDFIKDNFRTDRLVISCVGNIPFKKIQKLADRYLAHIPSKTIGRKRLVFDHFKPSREFLIKTLNQSHCIIGKPAIPVTDKRRIPFFLLVNLLGGPALNSRLNLSLRENNGLVYSVDANYAAYTDTGLFHVYFGTEEKQLKKSIHLVLKEFDKLKNKKMGVNQLHAIKQQTKGQLAMAEESKSGIMQMMGKSLLDFDRIDSLATIFDTIDRIEAEDIMDLANEVLGNNDDMSILAFVKNNGVY